MNKKSSRLFLTMSAVLVLGLLLSPICGKSNASYSPFVASASLDKLSLPLVLRNSPMTQKATNFGVEIDHLNTAWGLDLMAAARMTWAQPAGIQWSSIEPTPGVYDWSTLADLETELLNASNKAMQVILVVHSTPEWARQDSGTGPWCGPIAPDKLSYFGDFMHELVLRLSDTPNNVKYWELWNEEDVSSSTYSGDNPFGCWGDKSDTYFGGGYYADMLKTVYPEIKSAAPQAQVLIGGLLLDCDPRPGAGCDIVGHDPKTGLFLEGILQNNGGAYFDGLCFHTYDYYHQTKGGLGFYDNPNWQSAWNTTGTVAIAKAQFIQSVLNKYGVSGKYLMSTETALVCPDEAAAYCHTDEHSNFKAYYLAEEYAAGIAQGLRANLWYSTLGWRGSALLDSDLTPLPAYYALQFSRNEVGGAVWVRDIHEYTGVTGYEFNRGDRRIWILWSLDAGPHSIPLAGTPLAARDVMGNPVTVAPSMNITLSPLYLEWNP